VVTVTLKDQVFETRLQSKDKTASAALFNIVLLKSDVISITRGDNAVYLVNSFQSVPVSPEVGG